MKKSPFWCRTEKGEQQSLQEGKQFVQTLLSFLTYKSKGKREEGREGGRKTERRKEGKKRGKVLI